MDGGTKCTSDFQAGVFGSWRCCLISAKQITRTWIRISQQHTYRVQKDFLGLNIPYEAKLPPMSSTMFLRWHHVCNFTHCVKSSGIPEEQLLLWVEVIQAPNQNVSLVPQRLSGRPRTHLRNYISHRPTEYTKRNGMSHLAWGCLGMPQRDGWNTLPIACCHRSPTLDGRPRWKENMYVSIYKNPFLSSSCSFSECYLCLAAVKNKKWNIDVCFRSCFSSRYFSGTVTQ